MIGSLRGRLILKRPDNIIIETGGVGYHVMVPVNLLSSLPEVGEEVFLHIHTHLREDSLQLYGFSSEEEKRIFTTLLGITGIGPKMALNILSGFTARDFLKAIDSEDVALLCRVPGLGKKTAHRLILELREKLVTKEVKDRVFDDTLSALINLGYKRSEATDALERAYKGGYNRVEDLLKEALRYLTGGRFEKD